MNAGADELAVTESIIRPPEDLKAHLVSVQGEASDFGGLFCVCNILTRIHQHIKGSDTMTEVMKLKKDLSSLNMSEDEAITVYTFSVVVPSLLGGKRTNKSEIAYLPKYGKWRDKSFQKDLSHD